MLTQFDSYFKNFDIKPFDTQVKLIQLLKNNEADLIIYKTMMGQGKTSLVVALGSYCKFLREQNKDS